MTDEGDEGRGKNGGDLPTFRIVLPTAFIAACWVMAICAVLVTFWVLSR